MKNKAILLLPVLFISACASITNSKYQPVSVVALSADKQIDDVKCVLQNSKGIWYVTAPGSVTIQKSYGDMTITCKKPGEKTGIVSVTSSSNGSVWGNIFAGGPIGYAVDASSGAGFDYPTDLKVSMGETKIIQVKPAKNTNKDEN